VSKSEEMISYSAAMSELQSIVGGLEASQVGIDELTNKIARAKYLSNICRERLRKTDKEVKMLFEEGSNDNP